MDDVVQTRIKRIRQSMSLTGAIVATAVGVLLPVLLSTSVGIVALALRKTTEWTLFGVLVISFAAAAIGGGVVVTVLLSRKHRIARLQADFVANVTHELRTPLTAIRMYAQTLESGRLAGQPELFDKSVATILRETEWLETMIDRVLSWRGAARDMDDPIMKPLPLVGAVEVAVERFRRMTAGDDVSFNVALNSRAVVLHDARMIQSVLLNLLVNAFKYSPRQKVISVTLDDDGHTAVLAVADKGIGIDKRDLEKIFNPFYRVDTRLRSRASGAGLGLAIVRHYVALHNGHIAVESVPERGSRFVIRLPVATENEEA